MEDTAQLPNQYHKKAMKSTLAQPQKYPGIQLNITFTANADTVWLHNGVPVYRGGIQ